MTDVIDLVSVRQRALSTYNGARADMGRAMGVMNSHAAIVVAAEIMLEHPTATHVTLDWSDQGGDSLVLGEVILESGETIDAWDLECIDSLPYADLTHGWHDDLSVYDWSAHLEDMRLDLRGVVRDLS